ncbi:hypothetical protein GCM10025760_01810 [Microbacterium yannicii]|uniref:Uncharacterized protein n=1 Tax=Microbacterium yannicii TaxID=671622 RepID=A0ABP9LVM5_9MICO
MVLRVAIGQRFESSEVSRTLREDSDIALFVKCRNTNVIRSACRPTGRHLDLRDAPGDLHTVEVTSRWRDGNARVGGGVRGA